MTVVIRDVLTTVVITSDHNSYVYIVPPFIVWYEKYITTVAITRQTCSVMITLDHNRYIYIVPPFIV
jgi:hypothetical protein